MVDLSTRLRGVVGDKTAKALSGLGLETVEDLLRHYPRRYAELGRLTDLSGLQVGQHVTVMARVVSTKTATFGHARGRRPRTRTEVVVTDGTGRLSLTFFQQSWLEKKLTPGTLGLFAGEVGSFRGQLQLTHPDHEVLDDDADPTSESKLVRGQVPIYPATAKVPSWRIANTIELVLDVLDDVPDALPESVRAEHGLVGAKQAFEGIHRPYAAREWQRARDRFRFEEAFVLQTVFARRRHDVEQRAAVSRPLVEGGVRSAFLERLPFAFTEGQSTVADELAHDLAQSRPMHRLLQGEVGSGKTVVALAAMLQVVDAGAQAALLAPTEVLATQHHRSITQMLGDLAGGGMLGGADVATRVALLTGSIGATARRAALLDIQSGAAGIVVGTHALLEESVGFAELGLVVIDEQHRFGVEQRAALVDRADVRPHVLVMTATPIPRTIAMTTFGDLETSTLTELPAGRKAIQTTVVPIGEQPAWLERAWQRIREEVAAGRQAYVVASRIGTADEGPGPAGVPGPGRQEGAAGVPGPGRPEGAEEVPTRSVLDLAADLTSGPLADLRVGVLHGRLANDEKDAVMTSFARAELDVLVATTVIEVGVDVRNATVMVIVDADRFGMSQLHQLRGRVGRGGHAGLCLLVTASEAGTSARERLDAVAATADGFELSRLDVELRREGDVLGASQSGGRSGLRLLSVVRHEDVIVAAREDASRVVASDPTLAGHPLLAAAVADLEDTEQADYLERT